uniref:Uncharacterized protein n=1 Tax=Zea mays TaxID=4577 RepID=A0A804LLI6_MAIZE
MGISSENHLELESQVPCMAERNLRLKVLIFATSKYKYICVHKYTRLLPVYYSCIYLDSTCFR